MSDKKLVVDLSKRSVGNRKGKAARIRARILLLADEGRTDEEIAAALHTNRSTAERVRHRFVEEGLEAARSERPRPGAEPVLNTHAEAAGGRTAWSMQLLADELVPSTSPSRCAGWS